MANEWFMLADDYQVEQETITRPIYSTNIVRQGIFPIWQEADISDLQSIHYTELDLLQYEYRMEPQGTLTQVGITKTTTDVPVIVTMLYQSVDDLRRVNAGKIPYNDRTLVASRSIEKAELEIALTGATAAAHGTVVASVSGTGTQSTAAATEYNVTTWALMQSTLSGMIGQLIDGLEEIRHPLAFVMTPDVYKVFDGLTNANTDLTALQWTEQKLRSYHPASRVFMSKHLGGTYASRASSAGIKTFTAGALHACLFCVNPEWYGIQTSPLVVRSDNNPLTGLKAMFLERFRPIYKKKEAIIYSGTAVIA